MDFRLTEEQELLLESVDELMARYGTEEYFKECDEAHRWPKEFTDALLETVSSRLEWMSVLAAPRSM